MTDRADRFIERLRRLEEEGDLEAMLPIFSEDAELRNPTDDQPHTGREGARRFWDAYRRSFREIHSEFRTVVETDGAAMLEWRSRGATARGEPFEYDGVSVLEFEGDRVRRFRAYFDPAALGEQLTSGDAER